MQRVRTATPATLLVQPLLDALQQQAIPYAQESDPSFIVTPPGLSEFNARRHAPARATPRELRGSRIDIKSPPSHGIAVPIAHWPEDRLESKRFPAFCHVLNGQATLQIADYELHCPAGSFVLIPPGIPHPDGSVPHLEAFDDDHFCDLLWLYRWEGGLICHICHSRGTRHWSDNEAEMCFVTGPQSLQYFDLLADEAIVQSQAILQSQGNHKIYGLLVPIFLMILQRDLENGRFVHEGVSEASETPYLLPGEDPIMRAQSFIRNHLDQNLTIDKIAHLVFMSRSHFTKQFRKTTGKSFTAYLTEMRLEKAKSLLRDTDWPVEVICLRIGIKSSHLWSLFQQHFNQTPGEYRQSVRKMPAS